MSAHITFTNTHVPFEKLAVADMFWMEEEIRVCRPKLIITLREIATRTIPKNKSTDVRNFLNGEMRVVTFDK